MTRYPVDLQVKERIVGATVLVALGVLVIPWLLDGNDEPAPDVDPGLALPIADESAPLRTEVVDLEPTPDSNGNSRAVGQSEAEPEVEPAAQSVALDAEVREERREDSIEQSGEEISAAESARLPASETAAPVEAVAAETNAATAEAPTGGWFVQLGAFGEAVNARQLASRVATFGYSAEVSDFEVSGRTLHRVRVGGFASRAEAEAAQSSLSAHGFVAQVFPPE